MFDWFIRLWSTPLPLPCPGDLGREFAESGAAFHIQNMVNIHVEADAPGPIVEDEAQMNVAGVAQ